MPGRLRTASRPSRTWIADASYSPPLAPLGTAACWAAVDGGVGRASGVSCSDRPRTRCSLGRQVRAAPHRRGLAGSGRPDDAPPACLVFHVISPSACAPEAVRMPVHLSGVDPTGRASTVHCRPDEAQIPVEPLTAEVGGSVRGSAAANCPSARPSGRSVGRTVASEPAPEPAEPRLSRRCRGGRAPRPERGPGFQVGRSGRDLDQVTVPSPSSSSSRRSDGRGEQLAAGWPRRSSRCAPRAARRRTTPGCSAAATSAPTICGPAADTDADRDVDLPAVVGDQPAQLVAERLRVAVVAACAPLDAVRLRRRRRARRRSPGGAPCRVAAAARRAAERRRAPRLVGSPRASSVRVARCADGPARRPAGRRRRGSSLSGVTSPDRDHGRGRPRAGASGTSAATAAVTSTCSASATSSASRSRRPVSSSAKTSSRIRIGSSPSVAQQLVRRQPQRERERPGLAVAGVALGRQLAEGQARGRRGAGRPGEIAALELAGRAARSRRRQQLGCSWSISGTAPAASDRRGRPRAGRAGRRPRASRLRRR